MDHRYELQSTKRSINCLAQCVSQQWQEASTDSPPCDQTYGRLIWKAPDTLQYGRIERVYTITDKILNHLVYHKPRPSEDSIDCMKNPTTTNVQERPVLMQLFHHSEETYEQIQTEHHKVVRPMMMVDFL